MARKRMIDPNIWQSEDFSKLSLTARMIFIGMFSNADDEGRGRAKPIYLKSTLFPYDNDPDLTQVMTCLTQIAKHMSVIFYQKGQNEYYDLYNWSDWQTINRPQASKLPPFDESCTLIHGSFIDESVINHESITPNRIEKNIKEKNINRKVKLESLFERFWIEYPKKVKKQSSLKKWFVIDPSDELAYEIIEAVKKYKLTEQWQNKKYIPDPITFLNQKRWEDEIPLPKTVEGRELKHDYDIKI